MYDTFSSVLFHLGVAVLSISFRIGSRSGLGKCNISGVNSDAGDTELKQGDWIAGVNYNQKHKWFW